MALYQAIMQFVHRVQQHIVQADVDGSALFATPMWRQDRYEMLLLATSSDERLEND